MEDQAPPTPPERGAVRNRLKDYFVTGVLVLIPTVVTLWVLKTVLDFVDGFFAALPDKYNPLAYLPFPIPGVGVITTAILILFVGAFARNYLGRVTYHYGDRLMKNIPFVGGVYRGVKQMLETVITSPSENFRKVVLIEYPRKGVYTLAFLTGAARGEIQNIAHKHMLNVFVPTTPNPTSGYMLILPDDEVIPLTMTVEDAFKIIISGGMVNPGESEDLLSKHLPRPLPERVRRLEKRIEKRIG